MLKIINQFTSISTSFWTSKRPDPRPTPLGRYYTNVFSVLANAVQASKLFTIRFIYLYILVGNKGGLLGAYRRAIYTAHRVYRGLVRWTPGRQDLNTRKRSASNVQGVGVEGLDGGRTSVIFDEFRDLPDDIWKLAGEKMRSPNFFIGVDLARPENSEIGGQNG